MLTNAVLLAADHNLTDSIIISRVLNGRIDDYEILVRRYNSLLYKTAHGILRAEEDIEDVMQEAYIKGFKNLHQFKGESKFSTWLTRILINCALQHAGKLKGANHVPLDDVLDDTLDESEFAIENPKEEIEKNLKKALEGAISHLPVKYRVVFIMREIEQLSVAEVATTLNISEENVKIRSHRAKTMLKDLLRPKLNALEVFEFHASRCTLLAERVMMEIFSLAKVDG